MLPALGSTRRLGLGLAVLVVAGSTSARAQPRICEIQSVEPDEGLVDLLCLPPQFCSAIDECETSGFEMPVCGSAVEDLPNICRPRCGTIIGCTNDGDCHPFRDAPGTCLFLSTSAGETGGVCAYPGIEVTYCSSGSVDATRFAHCHTRPDGSVTDDYLEGDCDQDGCANFGDAVPCIPDEAPCRPLDLTLACSAVPIDRDAGLVPFDAGITPTTDAGGPFDAGTILPEEDAGPPIDAPAPVQASFGGGGGVRCTCTASRRTAPPLALLFVALALVVRRGSARRRG